MDSNPQHAPVIPASVKEKYRKTFERDIARYIAKGGRITQVAIGTSGEKKPIFNHRLKKR